MRHPAGVLPVSWRTATWAIVCTAVAAFYALWPVSVIQLESNDDTVRMMRVPRGTELYLDYQHSVARVPVREVFIINDGGGFLLIRTEHGAFGAGLPTESFGNFRQEGDVYINSGIAHHLSVIPLRVTTGSEQTLTTGDDSRFHLIDYFETNSLVTIRPRKLPRAGYIFLGKRFLNHG